MSQVRSNQVFRSRPSNHGLILALMVLATGAGASAFECAVRVLPMPLDFQHNSTIQQTHVPLPCPMPLHGALAAVLDAVVLEFSTGSGGGSFELHAVLLSGSDEVGQYRVGVGSHTGSSESRRIHRRAVDVDPGDALIDAIRFESSFTGNVSYLRCRGLYAGNTARQIRIYGEHVPKGCHEVRWFDDLPNVTLTSSSPTSEWVERAIDPPVAADLLRYVTVANFRIVIPISNSFTDEVELLLDNGHAVRLDNWQSPGVAHAPSSSASTRLWNIGSSLLVGQELSESLQGREIVGWRRRFHKQGSSTVQVYPCTGTNCDSSAASPTPVHFAMADTSQLGDLNGDGVVDVLDLLILFAAWGGCPSCDCPADLNGDQSVDVLDMLVLFANWG